jgi:hypothetical protein
MQTVIPVQFHPTNILSFHSFNPLTLNTVKQGKIKPTAMHRTFKCKEQRDLKKIIINKERQA